MKLTCPEKLQVVAKHQHSAPIQTVPLAQELGLKVWHVPNWPKELSGKIERSTTHGGSSGYAIFVNESHHKNRRRFTTAHEIAHFILHSDLIGDGIADDALYRSKLANAVEAQANKLAADILMPWQLLNQQIENGVNSVLKLAEVFQVSESAMAIRMGSSA